MFSNNSRGVLFDVFFHTWNFNTTSNLLSHAIGVNGSPNTLLASEEIDDLIRELRPTRYLIEDETVSPKEMLYEMVSRPIESPDPFSDVVAGDWTCSQFYSSMMSANLKRQHELENKFQYDICVKGRMDLAFDDPSHLPKLPLPESNAVHTVHSGYDSTLGTYRVGDIFYYSDSPMFDRLAQFYRFMPYLKADLFKEGVPPEVPFAFYIRMLRMRVCLTGIQIRVRRSEEHALALRSVGRELGDHEIL